MKQVMHAVSVVVALMLMIAACSDSSTTTTAALAQTPASSTIVAPTTESAATPTTSASSTTQAPATTQAPTTTQPAPTTTDLPGEPTEHFFFKQGDQLGVIGVAYDDVLNVRAAPGIDQEIVARLDPLAQDIVVTGPARSLPASIWIEVEVIGASGWVNSAFLAYIGPTLDVTSQVIADLGEIPRAKTMLDLGGMVAATRTSRDEEVTSTIIVTAAPTVGDLGEVTYDVLGLLDDAQAGERLHVFGRPLDGGEGFELKTVEGTQLCYRGGSPEEFCV